LLPWHGSKAKVLSYLIVPQLGPLNLSRFVAA
jgi:hypothetical protein